MQNNNALTYVNLDASNGFSMPTFDPASHDCTLPKLSQISLSFKQNEVSTAQTSLCRLSLFRGTPKLLRAITFFSCLEDPIRLSDWDLFTLDSKV
ncbi:MAG: hypothetical protein Ct9H90mP25_0230 [Gammaproteobacteria bacterium]|nr:MAG: hypothetical protein Ct9H90mP25_0230 [Gammaproteobacteria bacterium]